MSFKKAKFWNQKILSWEHSKYKNIPKFFDINASVKYRLYLTSSLLHQMSEKKNLLELGCGSGRLWDHISSLKLNTYIGVDFSTTAIEIFQNKIKEFKHENKISLFCEDCVKNTYSVDIVISLGLFDWLSMEKIKKITKKYEKCWYLHSFSEKSLSFSQMAHSFYSLVNYKYNVYSPKYRKAEDMLFVFGAKAKIYRDPELSFGAFIYNLPPNVQFQC